MNSRKIIRRLYIKYSRLTEKHKKFTRSAKWKKIQKYEQRKRYNCNKEHTNKKHNHDMIVFPNYIDFEKNLKNIQFLTKDIREKIKRNNYSINIELNQLRDISLNGLLYSISEIDMLQKAKPIKKPGSNSKRLRYNKKHGIDKNNEKLKYMLYKIGFFKNFGIKKPYKIKEKTKEKYFLSIKTSVFAETKYIADVRDFITDQIKFLEDKEIQDYFDDAISEAMANSVEHAYIEETPYRKKGKWWLCGHYDKSANFIEFSFRDYGVGLRKTIEYNSNGKIKAFLRQTINKLNKTDADIIKMLVNDELPKYKGKQGRARGYGFKTFKTFAKKILYNCEMQIMSGSGNYQYKYYNGKEYENMADMGFKIDGFLISWKIFMKDKKC